MNRTIGLLLVGIALALGAVAFRAAQLGRAPEPAVASVESRAAPGSPAAAEQPRTGYDPLSLAEQDRALAAARRAPAVARTLAAGRVEPLYAERHEEAKAVYARGVWLRRADVYFYDYGRDVVLHAIVDLGRNAVGAVAELRGVQPVLSPVETARALGLALADARVGSAIREQYVQLTGARLRGAGQVRAQGIVFRADARPDAASGEAAGCGVRRCAQLLLSTPDGQGLSVLPIIDLSRGTPVELSR